MVIGASVLCMVWTAIATIAPCEMGSLDGIVLLHMHTLDPFSFSRVGTNEGP